MDMEFQNALHSLVQALREEGRVAVHCLALSQSLQAASSKKIRLSALLCLHPIAVALKGSLDNLSSTSSKVVGTAPILPVDLPCLIAALSALGAAVRNAALGAARLLLSDMAVEKAVTDVYVLVLMALERVQTETTSRGEQADDENIILLCVAAYDALYTLIAQLIQALLYFSGHPSKAVTASALHCLDNLLILGWTCSGDLHKPTTWQPFYPGIFSGLYALTLHSGGVTSGRKCLYISLCAMLRATMLVLAIADETVEMHPETRSLHYDTMLTSLGIKRTENKLRGHSWRLKTGDTVAHKIITFLPVAYSAVYSHCSAAQKCTIVALLGTVLRDRGCCSFFSAKEVAILLRLLYASLTGCAGDRMPQLRSVDYSLYGARKSLVSLGVWPEIATSVQQNLREDLLAVLSLSRQGGREEPLSVRLGGVVGAVQLLIDDGDDFLNVIGTGPHGDVDWIKYYQNCMHALLVPNLAGRRITVLESNRYFGASRSDYVDGGYYRAECLSARWRLGASCTDSFGATCGVLIQEMCSIFGQNGHIDECVRAAQRSMMDLSAQGVSLTSPGMVDIRHRGNCKLTAWVATNQSLSANSFDEPDSCVVSRSREALEESRAELLKSGERVLQNSVGVWMTLKLALRGISCKMDSSVDNDRIDDCSKHIVSCAVCAKTESHSGGPLLQCSKCKDMSYCSREHQKRHWMVHKVKCVSPVGQPRLFSTPSASSGATVPMSTLTQSVISVCLACINEFISDCEAPINSFHQCEWVSSPCATLGAALLVGIASEIVADIAEITMTQFRPFLMQVLHPLLSLSVDRNPIVQVSAQTSLCRIGIYLGYAAFSDLLRANLDYIGDAVCSSVRESVLHSRQRYPYDDTGELTWSRVPLVVEKVMLTLDEQSSSVCDSILLRDMAWNILDAVDSYAACGVLAPSDVLSLLKVMHVIVERAILPLHPNISRGIDGNFPTAVLDAEGSLYLFTRELRFMRDLPQDAASSPDQIPLVSNDLSTEQEEVVNEEFEKQILESPAYNLLEGVISRCVYFLSLRDPEIQKISYCIVRSVLLKLKPIRSALLPTVHKLWPTLVNRLRDTRVLLSFASSPPHRSNASSHIALGDEDFETTTVKRPLKFDTSVCAQRPYSRVEPAGEKLVTVSSTESTVTVGPGFATTAVLSNKVLHNFPILVGLIMLLADICGDFVTLKFNDDFWPEINKILLCLCHQELFSNDSGESASLTARHLLGFRSLDCSCKIALLKCILKLSGGSIEDERCGAPVQQYMVRAAPSCAFFMLSLLHSAQALTVQQLAFDVIKQAMRLDPSFVGTLCCALCRSDASTESWLAVIVDPRLAPVFESYVQFRASIGTTDALSQSDMFERIFRSFRCDESILSRIAAIVSEYAGTSSEAASQQVLDLDTKWLHDIENWART